MITSKEEYIELERAGRTPLLDSDIEIKLRIAIQNELFGSSILSQGDIARGNVRFYKWVWKHKPHFCEEYGIELYEYSSKHVSHILSRQEAPEMRWDPRNTNILSVDAHGKWEDKANRYRMNIYWKNKMIIEKLKTEYYELG